MEIVFFSLEFYAFMLTFLNFSYIYVLGSVGIGIVLYDGIISI
jgi:hypothetical protein